MNLIPNTINCKMFVDENFESCEDYVDESGFFESPIGNIFL